MLLVDIVLV